jgi:glucose-6-phosphate dehydrogenase assembly protein OpcA
MIWTKLKPEKTWDESTGALNVITRCDGQQVCSEQLVLRCGNERQRIPSVVLPLIHPGLPTHLLWWKAGPLDCPLFRRLQDRSRLILWQPEAPPSNWALEFLERTWNDPYQLEHATYPLDWFRILGMRQAIANAHDAGPVEVRACDPGAHMSLPNRLLQAWLAARLGSSGEVAFHWTSGQAGCRIVSEPPAELSLIDDVHAVRVALDRADRDPVFAQTLKALLAPTAR